MIIGRMCICLAAVSLVAGGVSAASSSEEPLAFLQSGVDEVLEVAYGENNTGQPMSERIRPVLEEYFDLAMITRRAVGPEWRRFSEEERSQVMELFSTVVLRTYVDNFEPRERPVIEFGSPIELASNRWEVPTSTTYEGSTYSVAYRVVRTREGLRVYDVVVEGVSMISNYRGQFRSVMQRGGVDALVDSLRENLRRAGGPE